MASSIEPLPQDAPMVDQTLKITGVWYRWLSVAILGRLETSAHVTKAVTQPAQAGAIGASALGTGAGGVYRVAWVLRIIQPATGSSALTVTIAYTDGGVNVSQSGPTVTGNLITTVQSASVLVRADPATAVTYAVAYSSVGATPMKYTLTVAMETVNA